MVLSVGLHVAVHVTVRCAVDRTSYMIGSYAPRSEPYEYVTPIGSWPSGMLARGHYVASLKVRGPSPMFPIMQTYLLCCAGALAVCVLCCAVSLRRSVKNANHVFADPRRAVCVCRSL